MKVRLLVLAMASAGLVAACGGGGSSDTSKTTTTTTTTTPRETGKISLTGVVAIGRAVASTPVEVSCLGGAATNVTATATTGTDGSYAVTLNSASLPCVLKVSTSAEVLTSLAQGSGPGTATANITPFTTLVTASLAGSDPVQFVASFGPAQAAIVTPGGVAAAKNVVTSLLTGAGVDVSAVEDFLTGPLTTPESGSANAYDQALDALAASPTTLAELTSSAEAARSTPSLPANLLSQPQASNCAALRSGTYYGMMLMPSANTADNAPLTTLGLLTVDATALTLTLTGGTPDQLVANGACRYTVANGEEYVVSPAGIIVGRLNDNGVFRMGIAVPAQSITLADMAGTWNALEWNAGNTGFSALAGTATLDASGKVTAAGCFNQTDSLTATTCQPITLASMPSLATHVLGGFTLSGSDPQSGPWADRWFAYRAGGGELMVVSLSPNGSFDFWTRQRTNQLPTVGTTTTYWNFPLDTSATLLAINSSSNVIATASGSSFTRNNTVNLGTVNQVTRTETLQINSPRNGYTQRDAATSVRPFVSMGLRGMGLTPLYLPPTTGTSAQPAQFQLSVVQP